MVRTVFAVFFIKVKSVHPTYLKIILITKIFLGDLLKSK